MTGVRTRLPRPRSLARHRNIPFNLYQRITRVEIVDHRRGGLQLISNLEFKQQRKGWLTVMCHWSFLFFGQPDDIFNFTNSFCFWQLNFSLGDHSLWMRDRFIKLLYFYIILVENFIIPQALPCLAQGDIFRMFNEDRKKTTTLVNRLAEQAY